MIYRARLTVGQTVCGWISVCGPTVCGSTVSIDFVNSPDDTVRKQIAYRYNALRTKMELYQNRINEISNIVKLKNPSLLLQIQKAPSKLNNSMKGNNYYTMK